jgi:hypothetical protein
MRSVQEMGHDYFKNLPDEPSPYHLLINRFVENLDLENPDPVAYEAVLEACRLYEASPGYDQGACQ